MERNCMKSKSLRILESFVRHLILLDMKNYEISRNLSIFSYLKSYLIVDEACQCTEPSALIPLSLGTKKVIMVGDYMQLPATVFAENASKTLFNRSFFERLIDNEFPQHVLKIQYRYCYGLI